MARIKLEIAKRLILKAINLLPDCYETREFEGYYYIYISKMNEDSYEQDKID